MTNNRTFRLVLIAILSAMSVIIAKLFRFPIFPSAAFLKMDFGEVPLLLAAFLMPVLGGIIAVFLKELLSFFLFGTNIFAITANIIACGTFILVFSLIRQKSESMRRIIWALVAGIIARTFVSIPLNLFILPIQFGMPTEEVWAMMPYIIPFNFLKASIDALITVPIWQGVRTAYRQIAGNVS